MLVKLFMITVVMNVILLKMMTMMKILILELSRYFFIV